MSEPPPDPPKLTTGPNEIRRAALSGVAWSLIQSWGARIASTAAFVALARALDPSDFGVVALAVTFIELGQLLINRGFGASIIQRENLTEEDLDSAFWFSIIAGVSLMVICLATAGLVADAFDEPQLTAVLQVLSINWVLGALSSVPQNLLQRQFRFRSLAIRRLLAVTISGAIGVALAIADAGVWSLVVMAVTQSAIGVIVLWSVSSWRPRWRLSISRLRAMRRFAAGVVGIDLINFAAIRGEVFVLGAVVGPVPLGYYAVATRFLTLLNEVFTSTIGSVAFPVFSRLQNQRARRQRALLSVVRMCATAAFPIFAGLLVLAPEFIGMAFGPQWSPSIILTQLLALHGLRYSITYFNSSVILSTGNAGLELWLTIIGLAIKFVAVAIGIQWGAVGVAWAVVVTSYVTFPMGLWALKRTTGITAREYGRNVAMQAIAALVMVAVVAGARTALNELGDAATFALCALVGAITYVATLAVLAPSLFREIRALLGDLGRRPTRTTTRPDVVQL